MGGKASHEIGNFQAGVGRASGDIGMISGVIGAVIFILAGVVVMILGFRGSEQDCSNGSNGVPCPPPGKCNEAGICVGGPRKSNWILVGVGAFLFVLAGLIYWASNYYNKLVHTSKGAAELGGLATEIGFLNNLGR